MQKDHTIGKWALCSSFFRMLKALLKENGSLLLKIHKKLNMFEVARIFTFSIVASTYSTLQLVKKVLNRVEYPFVMMVSALHLAFAMSVHIFRSYLVNLDFTKNKEIFPTHFNLPRKFHPRIFEGNITSVCHFVKYLQFLHFHMCK